jgi:hypothetical protein
MGIDPLQLTPGTVFMEQARHHYLIAVPLYAPLPVLIIALIGQVREALCHYACERLLTVSLLHDLRFSISPATAPGTLPFAPFDVSRASHMDMLLCDRNQVKPS